MQVVGISNIGLHRKKNEDSFLIDKEKNLFVVCDGMGGHKGGDTASQLAITILNQNIDISDSSNIEAVLLKAVEAANLAIIKKGSQHEHLHEMGTTLTAAIISDSILTVAHVGDSGLFLLRNNTIRKITHDHTLAQKLLNDGLINADEVKCNAYNHVLTRALGINDKLHVDILTQELFPQDLIIICSDGLTDLLTNEEILKLAMENEDLENLTQELMNKALAKGGYDNITFILIRV